MSRALLIDVGLFETRAAVLEGDRLTDLSYYRDGHRSRVGELYLGRIHSFARGLDAAFVDLGKGVDGFLLARDVPAENKAAPIAKKLQEGQKIILQVTKDRKGDKGFQLSGFLKLESQNLVYAPGGSGISFAKKIKDAAFKESAFAALTPLLNAAGGGLTLRSRAAAQSLTAIEAEFGAVAAAWQRLQQSVSAENKPRCLLPQDPPVIAAYKKYNDETTEIIVNDRDSFEKLKEHRSGQGYSTAALQLWTKAEALFDAKDIEQQIDTATDKYVPLPSGGNITIEQTEALVAIDVNSGAQTETRHPASIALQTNLEAARVITRQIRLRNLSGIIIIDFIQMQDKGAVQQVTRLLADQTRSDPAQVRVIGITELGLMQLTRQRKEAPLDQQLQVPLHADFGTLPVHIVARLLRDMVRAGQDRKSPNIPLKAGRALTPFLKKKAPEIEKHLALNILWKTDNTLAPEDYQLG